MPVGRSHAIEERSPADARRAGNDPSTRPVYLLRLRGRWRLKGLGRSLVPFSAVGCRSLSGTRGKEPSMRRGRRLEDDATGRHPGLELRGRHHVPAIEESEAVPGDDSPIRERPRPDVRHRNEVRRR